MYTTLRLMHFCLDPMIVDPLHSDPTMGSVLLLCSSLDIDLMVQDLSTTLMVVVAPPPELFDFFFLGRFLSVQRFRPLNFLLRTRLLWVSLVLLKALSLLIFRT
jgi:hypothetical protein